MQARSDIGIVARALLRQSAESAELRATRIPASRRRCPWRSDKELVLSMIPMAVPEACDLHFFPRPVRRPPPGPVAGSGLISGFCNGREVLREVSLMPLRPQAIIVLPEHVLRRS
jgi:hypothetical protein